MKLTMPFTKSRITDLFSKNTKRVFQIAAGNMNNPLPTLCLTHFAGCQVNEKIHMLAFVLVYLMLLTISILGKPPQVDQDLSIIFQALESLLRTSTILDKLDNPFLEVISELSDHLVMEAMFIK